MCLMGSFAQKPEIMLTIKEAMQNPRAAPEPTVNLLMNLKYGTSFLCDLIMVTFRLDQTLW